MRVDTEEIIKILNVWSDDEKEDDLVEEESYHYDSVEDPEYVPNKNILRMQKMKLVKITSRILLKI